MCFNRYLFVSRSYAKTLSQRELHCTYKYQAQGKHSTSLLLICYILLPFHSTFRDNLIVQLLLPNILLQVVNHEAIRNGQLIKVVPVMFTQGVHDIQVLSK